MSLWASEPDPNMGQRARDGANKLFNSFYSFFVGSPPPPKATATTLALNAATGSTVNTGSLTNASDYNWSGFFSGFNWHPVDAASKAITDAENSVSDAIGQGINSNMQPYVAMGIMALGAIIIMEGLAG